MMIPGGVQILVAKEPVDFRKMLDGLCGVVRNELKEDPLSPKLFVFHNRRGDQVRVLWWDRNGFAMLMKRLDRGVFQFGNLGSGITVSQLSELLQGAVVVHKTQ